MVSSIKEICIFMIAAQAVLFFVPEKTYVKYVRVLVGIIMILQILGSLLGPFMDEEKRQEISRKAAGLEAAVSMNDTRFTAFVPDAEEEILKGVLGELRQKLEGCKEGYRILDVSLRDDGGEILITVAREDRKEASGEIRIDPVKAENDMQKIEIQGAGVAENDAWGSGASKNGGADQRQGEKGESAKIRELKELYGSCLGVESGRIAIELQ